MGASHPCSRGGTSIDEAREDCLCFSLSTLIKGTPYMDMVACAMSALCKELHTDSIVLLCRMWNVRGSNRYGETQTVRLRAYLYPHDPDPDV